MQTTEMPENLRQYAGKNGWLVASKPRWYAWKIVRVFESPITMRLIPQPDKPESDDGWHLRVLSSRGDEITGEHDSRASCALVARRVEKAATVVQALWGVSGVERREAILQLSVLELRIAYAALGLHGKPGHARYDDIISWFARN